MHTNFWTDASIIKVELTSDGNLEVVKRYPSHAMLLSCPPKPAPDTITKEIYGVSNGKIVLKETKCGLHKPAYTVHEEFSF